LQEEGACKEQGNLWVVVYRLGFYFLRSYTFHPAPPFFEDVLFAIYNSFYLIDCLHWCPWEHLLWTLEAKGSYVGTLSSVVTRMNIKF